MTRSIALALVWLLLASGVASAEQYWKVGADSTHVWSLDSNGLINTSDPTYAAWHAAGGFPTTIASTSELYDVIAQSDSSHLAASAPALEAAGGLDPRQSLAYRRAAGLTITYTGVPSLSGTYAIDDLWLSGLVSGALLRCGMTDLGTCSNPFPDGAATYTYVDMHGAPHTMTAAQMSMISKAIQDYFAALYAQLQIALGGGTPSWPSASVTIP